MIHPYKYYPTDPTDAEITYIEVTLEICTLYKGVPHGPAIIFYNVENDTYYSFRGVGTFKNG